MTEVREIIIIIMGSILGFGFTEWPYFRACREAGEMVGVGWGMGGGGLWFGGSWAGVGREEGFVGG